MPKTVKSVSKEYRVNDSYNLRPENLEKIIKVLEFSKENIRHPVAFTIILQVEDAFNVRQMTSLIKSRLQSYGYGLAYSFEHSDRAGLHVQLMVCMTTRGLKQPVTIAHGLRQKLQELPNVRSAQIIKRLSDKKDYFHRLHIDDEFKDAVYRYSYISKNNDKGNVLRSKKFGTSKAKGTSVKNQLSSLLVPINQLVI